MFKRVMSLLLAAAMVISMVPVQVFAEESEPADVAVETTAPVQEESEAETESAEEPASSAETTVAEETEFTVTATEESAAQEAAQSVDYLLTVATIAVTDENLSGTCWQYDPDENVLYLQDGFYGAVRSKKDHLTVEVDGAATVNGLSATVGTLTLRGKTGRDTDSVTIGYGQMYTYGSVLTVENLSVDVTCENAPAIVVGAESNSGDDPATGCLTVKDASVSAYSKGSEALEGIYVGTLQVEGSSYVYGRSARSSVQGIYASKSGSSFSSQCHVEASTSTGSAFSTQGLTLPEYAYVYCGGVYGPSINYELVATAEVFGTGYYGSDRSFEYIGVDHASYQQNTDGVTHSLVCACDSGAMGDAIACSGGEANCIQRAICDICGSGYGEIDEEAHVYDVSDGLCDVCGSPAGVCGEDLIYLLKDGTLYIYGESAMEDFASGGAPWYDSREEITCVSMTRGITSIGTNAFEGCSNLTQLKVWDTVTAIGENAFAGCEKLEVTYSGTANQWRQMGCKVPKTVCSDGILWDFGSCGDNLVYILLDETLQIFVEEGMEGSGIMEDYASGGAPWYALRDRIAQVSLAEGITSIGSYAFDGCCSGMSILTLPKSVTDISANAFTGWTGLKHIYIESTVTAIGAASKAESPFYGCAEDLMIYCQATSKPSGWNTYWNYDTNGTVASTTWNVTPEDFAYWSTLNKSAAVIEIPEGILQIPTKAFLNCTNLTGITIPEGLTTINSNAFSGCTGLTHIYIPETVTTIRASSYTYSPFSGCSEDLAVYCHVDTRARGWGSYWNHAAYGVVLTTTYSCDRENYNYWSTLDKTAPTVDIPEYITLIPVKAFYNRTTLTGVTIPDSVTVIHNNAFTGCSNLRHIFIPASVTTIIGASYSHAPFDGTGATLYCEVRTSQEKWEEYWNYGANVKWGHSREEYLEWCDLDLSGPDLVIPEGITSIPYRAFEYRSDLASVMIPETVRTIGDEAFVYCQGLTDITLPEGVETIGSGAFSNCTALLSVSIPASVTEMSDSMFQGSNNILYFWVDDLSSTYATDVFGVLYNKDTTRLVRVPGALEGSYEIPDSVTTIGPGAFQGCDGLKWVFIPDSVTTMEEDSYSSGAGSFADTAAYLNIFCAASEKPSGWPESWNSSRSAFFGCSGDEIEYWDKLDKTASVIEIPAGIAAIPNEAFAGCTGLTDVIIPEGVTGIGINAFKDCTGLTRIWIPATVQSIYSEAFSGCESNLKIYCSFAPPPEEGIPSGWSSIAGYEINYGYTRADMLLWPSVDRTAADVVLPDGIESIVAGAFMNSTTLKSITVPESVTSIGYQAF